MIRIREILSEAKNIDSSAIIKNAKVRIFANKASKAIFALMRFFLLFSLSFIILYPLLYMISVSFRNPTELLDPTVVWIPKTFTLDNIKITSGILNYFNGLTMSAVISLLCSILQCFTCSLAGYGFARFKFRFRNILFMVALFTLIVPPQNSMMPMYINYINFTEFTKIFTPDGIPMINTIWPIALPAFFGTGIRAGLFIYIFRQFYKNMPSELEDAAYIDGCSPFAAFWRVMFVNSGPVLLVAFLFSIVWYWNDIFNVSLFFTSARPLSVSVDSFREALAVARKANAQAYSLTETAIFMQVACLMFISPVLIAYVFLQKYFTQSIVRAGIVG